MARNRGISLGWQQRKEWGKQRILEGLSGHAHLSGVWCVCGLCFHACVHGWLSLSVYFLQCRWRVPWHWNVTHTHFTAQFSEWILFWLPVLLVQVLWTTLTCHQAFQLSSMPSAPSSCLPWAKLWCQTLNMPKALLVLAINIPPLLAPTRSSFLGFMSLFTQSLTQSFQLQYPKLAESIEVNQLEVAYVGA